MAERMRQTRFSDDRAGSLMRVAASRSWRLRTSAFVVAAAFGAGSNGAIANPQGAKVVSGSATITNSGNSLVIKNTPGAIINWQSFSIGAGETTNFIQQSVNSAILNRVVGVDPSVILGTLTSNGHVYLVNPNGVVFGKGAMVDAAGLVVSSLDITDQDFKNGTLRFVGSDTSGSISVAGVLRSSDGDVYLIAPNITNSGSITAVNGNVTLAAGQDVEILGNGLTDIQFNVQNKGNTAVNLGQINGDAVGIFAGTITQAGGVNATTATVAGGKVLLSAPGDITLASGSTTSADNAAGTAGSVAIQSGTGNISVAQGASVSASGATGGSVTLLASGGSALVTGSIAASGTLGLAGMTEILGSAVSINSGGSVDASGAAGGGQIVVGGYSKSGSLMQAQTTTVAQGASLAADATGDGDGGTVSVYGGQFMRMDGSISARGGLAGGNGGYVETSGDTIAVSGTVNAAALNKSGKAGSWLLDPDNVVIGTGTGGPGPTIVDASGIAAALDNDTNVTISTAAYTGSVATGAYLNVTSPINATAVVGTAVSLTLIAGGPITISAAINGTPAVGSSGLTLNLTSANDGPGNGGITINAPISLPQGTLNATGDSFVNGIGNTIIVHALNSLTTGSFSNNGTVDASAASNGSADGGNINISSAASVITGNLIADSQSGATGSIGIFSNTTATISGNLSASDASLPSQGAAGGGSVSVVAAAIQTSVTGLSIAANGGSSDLSAQPGGSIELDSTAGAINLSAITLSANGGTPLMFYNGGAGGHIGLSAVGGPLELTNVTMSANGGNAANTPAYAVNSPDGGSGGTLVLYSNAGLIINGGSLSANGGVGVDGIGGTTSYGGSYGGDGGSINLSIAVNQTSGYALSLSNVTLSATGAPGHAGGLLTSTSNDSNLTAGYGGNGGFGGQISMNGSGGMRLSGVTILTNGGAGGAGGGIAGSAASSIAGSGGAGGQSGSISIESYLSDISLIGTDLSSVGGAGGAGGTSTNGTGGGGSGGPGGGAGSNAFGIEIIADSGMVSIDGASSLIAAGGAGGAGGMGYLNTSYTSAPFGQGGAGGYGGNSSGIEIYGYTGLQLGGNIQVIGGNGGVGGTIGGTDNDSGTNRTAGAGGIGGIVLDQEDDYALTAFSFGTLTNTATIMIAGGAGGNGGQGLDLYVMPGEGGAGGTVSQSLSFFGETGVSMAGPLSIVGGQGGGTFANLLSGTPLGAQAGAGGSVTELGISAGSGSISISAPISLKPGAAGVATNGGFAGSVGSLEGVSLYTTGAVSESGTGAIINPGHLNTLSVNATGSAVGLTGDNQIDLINGTAMSGDFNVRSLVSLSALSGLSVPGNIILTAAGSTSTLEIDGELDSGASITLSGGAGIVSFAPINATAGNISLSGGTLSLNGNDVTAGGNLNISVAGSLLASSATLTASGYYLNAGGSVGATGAPIALASGGGATLGGTAGGGFYVDGSGELTVLSGSGLGIMAGGAIVINSDEFLNQGMVQGASVTLNQNYDSFNQGSLGASGAVVVNTPFFTTSGYLAGSSITISAGSGAFLSGAIAAQSGDLVIDSSAVQIGFNSHSTSISAQNINISAGSLVVSPDISGSGFSTGTGNALVEINAAGTLTVTTTGDATFAAGAEQGAYVSLISAGDSTYNIGGTLNLSGGSGVGAYALLDPTTAGSVMNVNATNVLLQGGSAMGAYAAIGSAGNMIVNAPSGAVMLNSGSATDADAVLIALSGGMVTLNTPSCINCSPVNGATPIGDGATESGVYSVSVVAPPPPPPPAPPPAPSPGQAPAPAQIQVESLPLDQFVNDILTLLILPVTALTTLPENSSIYVDGATDGCF